MKTKITKTEFKETMLKKWIASIDYDCYGNKGAGVTVEFICALEDVQYLLEGLYGKGQQGNIKFNSIPGSKTLPKELIKNILNAKKAYQKSLKSCEKKYKGYLYSGCLVYIIGGNKVLGKSIHKICKEKGKNGLEKALEDYNFNGEIGVLLKEYPLYHPPDFGR